MLSMTKYGRIDIFVWEITHWSGQTYRRNTTAQCEHTGIYTEQILQIEYRIIITHKMNTGNSADSSELKWHKRLIDGAAIEIITVFRVSF